MQVFINLTKEKIQVRIGRESLDVTSWQSPENVHTSNLSIKENAFKIIIEFIEKYAYSDRIILKNKVLFSTPRKGFVRTEFTKIQDITWIDEFIWYLGNVKIYGADDISFEDLVELKITDKTELFKKHILDFRLKHQIGDSRYSRWLNECLLIHLSSLLIVLIEFYFFKTFIFFALFLWLVFAVWFRRIFKSPIYNLIFYYLLILLPLYILCILIAANSIKLSPTSDGQLTFIGSVLGALVYLIIHYLAARLYLHLYKPRLKENKKRATTTPDT